MSKWKNTESWNRGQAVESDFSKLLKKRDPDFKKASRSDQFKHIDYHTFFGTIDVKAMKKLSRSANNTQEDLIWLEFKNVQGKVGWLCGNTDVIAFERKDDFVLVNRGALLDWAEQKCDLNRRVSYSGDALYKGYQRKGRKDLISIVKMRDITDQVPHRVWSKD